MTATPWGDSDSLRERRLRPLRGASRALVERNQRDRLYAATVAVVSEKGFARTTLADLLATAGVSSRTFYRHFPDKTACLGATVIAVLERFRDTVEAPRAGGDPAGELIAYLRRVAVALAEQPAAAKLCLVDAFAAGPRAQEGLVAARQRLEVDLRRLYREIPGQGTIPDQLLAARFGALIEIAVSRLRRGSGAELPGLVEELVPIVLAEQPPPRNLLPTSRPPVSEPEPLAALDHVERAIRAFAVLVAEQGYAQTNVEDVIRRASMSSTTFYEHFSGKDDLMYAAIDNACALALAAALPAFSRASDWPDAVRAGFAAVFNFLASRPDLARLALVESYVAGDRALARCNQGLAPLAQLLVNNTNEWTTMPPLSYELIAGTLRSMICTSLSSHSAAALPALAPLCTYVTLAPFLGAQSAKELATAGPGLRPARPAATRRAQAGADSSFERPLRWGRWHLLSVALAHRDATAGEIAAEVGEDPATVVGSLRELVAIGVLESLDLGGEARYRLSEAPHRMFILSEQQEAAMDPEERAQFTRIAWEMITADVESSIADGVFNQPDRWITRTPLVLDAQGWQELSDLHDHTLMGTFDIQARSQKRLGDSAELPIHVRSLQLAFEMPPSDAD